eukprot:m.528986 g.528986  ORF g.528986 m.528986 type:complete len:93 (+) comp22015_c0_seq89:890-1168(+)
MNPVSQTIASTVVALLATWVQDSLHKVPPTAWCVDGEQRKHMEKKGRSNMFECVVLQETTDPDRLCEKSWRESLPIENSERGFIPMQFDENL